MHQSAGPYHTPGPDPSSRHDRRAYADQGPFANGHFPSQMRAGRNMDVPTDVIVMIHGTTGIEDDIRLDDAPRINHAPGADHAARPDPHIRRNDGTGVTGNDKAFPLLLQPLEQTLTDGIIANPDDEGIVRDLRQDRQASQDRQPHEILAVEARIVVEIADRLERPASFMRTHQNVGDDLSMSSRPDDQHAHVYECPPRNSCVVASPSWLIPSRLRILHTVRAMIFKSSHSD